ncbi:MAG: response regulator transcription factor [Solirubrobacteraceae bacterium]
MAVRVGVADDSFLIREALTRLLGDSDEIELVAVCVDGDELAAAVEACHPDVVVVDIRMPPTMTDEGIRLAAQLRRSHPDVGVIVMSAHAEPTYVLALLEAGSEGRAYLLKDRLHSRAQLLATIETVARGGSVIDPKVVEALVHGRARQARSPLDALTPREQEILVEMARGASNAAIAKALGLTKRAVEKHINAVFAKLDLPLSEDVSRRVRAVLLFLAGTDRVLPTVDASTRRKVG